ncbi:MAG: methionine biosynthesis protein MetW, partial [Brevinematia bacterium]
QLRSPGKLLDEVLRISKKAIISFPNFGNIKVRFYLLFKGEMPVTSDLPYSWFNTPNIHLFTYKDFINLCKLKGISVEKVIPIARAFGKEFVFKFMPNLFAEDIIVLVSLNKIS